MENNKLYKIYQVESVLVTNYGFNEILLKKYSDYFQKESWLVNYDDNNYQVIRISLTDKVVTQDDRARINEYMNYFVGQCGKMLTLLDIHICNEKYDEELFNSDYINIEDNYYDGIDLKQIYPKIYGCIHTVADPKSEIKKQFKRIANNNKEKEKNLPFFKRRNFFLTYVIIFICCLMFAIQSILSIYIDKTSTFLLLGADYKLLTLGCNEYYRLITYAFLHSDIVHLFCNMVSLYSLGRIVEFAHGKKGFLIVLFTSIICGSLTQGILADNELCIGISGGIYGLFVFYLIDVVKSRIIDIRRLIPVVLLNVLLNFTTNTAWMCHLGGTIAGIATYFALANKKDFGPKVLVIVLVVCLLIKYLSISSIETFYGGTDLGYIDALKTLNFDTSRILSRIMSAYNKYGG